MRLRSTLLALLVVLPVAAFAAERGVFGFSMSVDSEGFFLNPTLRSIKIEKVVPASPAERAGLLAGDEVLEVEGRVVAGAKGREIQALAEKNVGETLKLKVKHPGGDVAALTLVAVAKAERK